MDAIDLSSPQFLQRRIESRGSYERIYPAQNTDHDIYENLARNRDHYDNVLFSPNQHNRHVKNNSGPDKPNSILVHAHSRDSFGDVTPNAANYAYQNIEETSPFMRPSPVIGLKPRANTAPSRRKPLNQNAASTRGGESLFLHLETSQFQMSRVVVPELPSRMPLTELSVETCSLPGSPKFIPRKGSLPSTFYRKTSSKRAAASVQNNNNTVMSRFCSSCALIAATLPTGWHVTETVEGLPYFIDHNTRSTHWRLPWLPACRSCEEIQKDLIEARAPPMDPNPPPPPLPIRKPLADERDFIRPPTKPRQALPFECPDNSVHEPICTNYCMGSPVEPHHQFTLSNSAGPGSRLSSSGYVPCNQLNIKSREALRRLADPARPLTRLPNALPLDVAIANESCKKTEAPLKSPSRQHVAEAESPDEKPKRPQHPSVESQLLFLLESQPDFFIDTFYRADEKLDRMMDFTLFDPQHLEVMRDSLDKIYFEECQAVCASYEKYRMALTDQIQKRMEMDLKQKHKRQLNHIKNCSAKSDLRNIAANISPDLESHQNLL